MEMFLIYLWLKMDDILGLFSAVFMVSSFAVLFGLIPIFATDINRRSSPIFLGFLKWYKRVVIAGVVSMFITIFAPNAKDVAILVGASIAIDMANSPEGQKIVTLIRHKANEYLDTELQKLQPIPVLIKKD